MKPMKNCPECDRPLEPATLNPEHRWCSVCATEYDKENKPVVRPGTEKKPIPTSFPGSVKVEPRPPQNSPEALAASGPETQTHEQAEARHAPNAAPTIRFRVFIGPVFFIVTGETELDIAGTKVRIQAL